MFGQVEKLSYLLASRTELKTTGNSEATDSRCEDMNTRPQPQWTTGTTLRA